MYLSFYAYYCTLVKKCWWLKIVHLLSLRACAVNPVGLNLELIFIECLNTCRCEWYVESCASSPYWDPLPSSSLSPYSRRYAAKHVSCWCTSPWWTRPTRWPTLLDYWCHIVIISQVIFMIYNRVILLVTVILPIAASPGTNHSIIKLTIEYVKRKPSSQYTGQLGQFCGHWL